MKNILFIDDSEDNLNLYKIYFKKVEEIEVNFVGSAQAGIDEALNHEYDLIFLDIQMPDLDGFEVLSKLRSEGVKSKIVALTGFSDSETISKIEGANFDNYLKKPILKKDLLKFVENG